MIKNKLVTFVVFVIIIAVVIYNKNDFKEEVTQVKQSFNFNDGGDGRLSSNPQKDTPNSPAAESSFTSNISKKIIEKLIQENIKINIDEVLEPVAKVTSKVLPYLAYDKSLLYVNKSFINVKMGEGRVAQCGDKVQISYEISTAEKEDILSTKDKITSLSIGKNSIARAIERAVIGMKEGGVRKFLIPKELGFDEKNYKEAELNKEDTFLGKIKLIKVEGTPITSKSLLQLFDNTIDNATDYIYCGDKINVAYKVTRVNGDLIYDSGFNEFAKSVRVGSEDLPVGLNMAIEGMAYNGKRTAIIPPELIVNQANKKTNFFPKHINLPKEEILIFEIMAGDIKD